MFPALTDAHRQRVRTAGPVDTKAWRNFNCQTHTSEHRRSDAGHEPRRRNRTVTDSSMILTERGTDGLTADRHALRGIRYTYCGMTMCSFYWLSGSAIWTASADSVQVCEDIAELASSKIYCDDVWWLCQNRPGTAHSSGCWYQQPLCTSGHLTSRANDRIVIQENPIS